jgi:CRISPR-associated protein Csd2
MISSSARLPATALFDLVRVNRKDESKPARAFTDYEVVVDEASIPDRVTLIRRT